MLGTRPFRSGDSLRRVHWAQTARQQQLIVCERQSPSTTCVRLVVDMSLAAHSAGSTELNEETSEMCVRTAASILESLHRQHAQVELTIGQQLIVVGESVSGFQRAMDVLARADILDTAQPSAIVNRSGMNIFTILVTTTAGLQTDSASRGLHAAGRGLHVVECAAGRSPQPGTRSWIRLQSLNDIADVLLVPGKAPAMSGDQNVAQRSPIISHAVRERGIVKSDRLQQNRLTDAALQWLCVSMTLIAAAVFLVTEADGNRTEIAMTLEMLGWSSAVITAAWWVRRKVAALPETSFMMPLLILVVLLSLAWEPIQRLLLDSGRPFEMLIMFSQKNLMLALAVFGCRISCQRLAVIIAVFLTIFCAVISSDRLVQALVGCFAVLAILWLTAGYWESIRVRC